MNFLFIHGNFPAQFKNIATALATTGHKIIYIANQDMANDNKLEGVEIVYYKCHRKPSINTHHYLEITEQAVINGQAIVRKILEITTNGFKPDYVITHAGSGYGLFTKDLLPEATHIGYFEWYFLHETTKHLVKGYDINTKFKVTMRNMPILQELETCDLAVVPTEWQKKQFPVEYEKKLNVIFDGVDKNFFRRDEKADDEEREITLTNRDTKEAYKIPASAKVVSYATRGMETLRGFPEYMELLCDLMKSDENIIGVVAGADRRAYSYDAPTHNGSWKQYMISKLGKILPKERILFTGLLDYSDYRKLLWRADVHCYFTREYVTSWSFFEAAACGANIVVNKNGATENIVEEESVTWIDLNKKKNIIDQIRIALAKKKSAKLLNRYYMENTLKDWEKILNKRIERVVKAKNSNESSRI